MEAAPSAKPRRREPPPIPPNYVSLQQLQQLRLKEKEEAEEKRRREEAEAEAAAAAAAAKRAAALMAAEEAAMAAAVKREAALKAEKAANAVAAAVKREAALKAETKGRAVSREGFCGGGAKERHRGGQQGHHHQWVAVAHRAPATTPLPAPTRGEVAVAAREKEGMVGGNRGNTIKGSPPPPDDVADNAPHPHGGCKPLWKEKEKGKGNGNWKRKKKASSCHTVGEPGNLAEAEAAAPAASNGGVSENKIELLKATGKASGAPPLDPAKAAVASSRGHSTFKERKGAGGRTAETSPGDAPAKTAGPSPPRGVKSGNTGKPKPAAPRLADAGTGREAAPVQAPPTSAADGCSKPKSGGPPRKTTVEAKPEGLVEGQRRQPARAARRSAEPWLVRGNRAAEPHGRVWVPKEEAAAVAGSSAGGGDK